MITLHDRVLRCPAGHVLSHLETASPTARLHVVDDQLWREIQVATMREMGLALTIVERRRCEPYDFDGVLEVAQTCARCGGSISSRMFFRRGWWVS